LGILLFIISFADVIELVDLWRSNRRDDNALPNQVDGGGEPRVSIHIPICSEPPEVVINSLDAIALLHYRNYEVIVVDNNTSDERLWFPIKDYCASNGSRYRFFHLSTWPGYKAGALNFALAKTVEDAEIVAVLDADYAVDPNYLNTLTSYFSDPTVKFVQAPQAYRLPNRPTLHTLLISWEYWQFFVVGMQLRAKRNAIMLHGTMVLVRKSALEAVCGWSEWCVTDDSETGIRLLSSGGRAVYVPMPYGRGLTPFTHEDFLLQRRRWVIGGAQQLRMHWKELIAGKLARKDSQLTIGQRLHFFQGWVAWIRDALLVLAWLTFMTGSAILILAPGGVIQLSILSYGVLMAVGLSFLRHFIVYRYYLRRSIVGSLAMTGFVLGMTRAIGMAWINGMVPGAKPFFKTPKRRHTSGRNSFPYTDSVILFFTSIFLLITEVTSLGIAVVFCFLLVTFCSAGTSVLAVLKLSASSSDYTIP
jgi:cellulose synthase/poly-beta-1,6-N-acetylglucosamine synthase-like glycosyltransferase